MGAIVLDTNAVVRAVLSPAGARRKLWLLLVYGGSVHRAKQIREEFMDPEDQFMLSGLVCRASGARRRSRRRVRRPAGG